MREFIDICNKISRNNWFLLVYVPIAFLYVLFFSYANSPLYIADGLDSTTFKTMGQVILDGGVPYVNYFDHKGPIVYFIQALGILLLPDKWGIYVLLSITIAISLMIWNKISRLFLRPAISFLATLIPLYIMTAFVEDGNQVEIWMLIPISLSVFFAVKYLLSGNSKHPYWHSVLYGLCFGIVFFIRPNDAVASIGGIMFGLFLYILFVHRDWKNSIYNALCFAGGIMIIAIPIILYFAYHHALYDAYMGIFGFNLLYFNQARPKGTGGRLMLGMVLLYALSTLLACLNEKKNLSWILIPIGLFTAVLIGKRADLRYYIPLVPSAFVLISALIFAQTNVCQKALGLFLLLYLPSQWGGGQPFLYVEKPISEAGFILQRLANNQAVDRAFYSEGEKLLSEIPKSERDSIWCYNWWGEGNYTYSILFKNGIVHMNRFPPVIARYSFLPDNYIPYTKLENYYPLWLLTADYQSFGKIYQPYDSPEDSIFINTNYECIAKSNPEIVHLYLWKRKD